SRVARRQEARRTSATGSRSASLDSDSGEDSRARDEMGTMSRVEDLFERFRSQGDTQALGQVFDELGTRLQRIARHLAPDRAAAEDLVQATFLTAIEKRDAFDASRALEPWLTGILIQHASLA